MSVFSTIFNYIWFFIKLCGVSVLLSLPIILFVYLFKFLFKKINKKKSFLVSMFVTIYLVSLIIILGIYFIPTISINFQYTFFEGLFFVILHLFRLIITNILIAGILLVFAFIISLFYDKFNKSKKELNFLPLLISTSITSLILIIINIIFPKLIAMIMFIIFV